jgi:hypothetical protein
VYVRSFDLVDTADIPLIKKKFADPMSVRHELPTWRQVRVSHRTRREHHPIAIIDAQNKCTHRDLLPFAVGVASVLSLDEENSSRARAESP